MKIYNIIYEEICSDFNLVGFENKLYDVHTESFTTLELAKNRLKILFQEIKDMDIFNKHDFNNPDFENSDTLYYYDSIDKKDSFCCIAEDEYEYAFIAKIEEVELK